MYNLFEVLHLWRYFIAGVQPGVILAGGLLHDREVVVPSLLQPCLQERFPFDLQRYEDRFPLLLYIAIA